MTMGVSALNLIRSAGGTLKVHGGGGTVLLGRGRLRTAGVRATLGGARKRKIPRPLEVPAAGMSGAVGATGGGDGRYCSTTRRSLGRRVTRQGGVLNVTGWVDGTTRNTSVSASSEG